jgi:hypothetical protein
MGLNIVSSQFVSNCFKKSRFFRKNLGLVSTIDKNGKRIANDKDKFSSHYNGIYRTTIFAQGNVGDIKFYIDHYIRDNTFAVYSGDTFEEFIFTFDVSFFTEKGADNYLGFILKSVDDMYEERVKNNELKKLEPKPVGNADMITKNPGNVSYADLKAYLEKKRAERYKKFD